MLNVYVLLLSGGKTDCVNVLVHVWYVLFKAFKVLSVVIFYEFHGKFTRTCKMSKYMWSFWILSQKKTHTIWRKNEVYSFRAFVIIIAWIENRLLLRFCNCTLLSFHYHFTERLNLKQDNKIPALYAPNSHYFLLR